MQPVDLSPRAGPAAEPSAAAAYLRLYVARSTPNSVRAEQNLTSVLRALPPGLAAPVLEIIDVFLQPRRAMTDGVVVTPTLIGMTARKRIVLMGDLADQDSLRRTIQDLT